MNRNELIAQMKTVMPIVNNWIQLNDQIYKRKKSLNELEYAVKESKPGVKSFLKNLWLSLVGCFMFGGIFLLPVEWFTPYKITLTVFCYFNLFLTVILTVVLCIRSGKDYKVMKGNLPRARQEYADLQAQYAKEVSANMSKIYAIFPKKYATPWDIKKIYSYLVDCRADSMKEAINLLEHENYQQEQNRQIDALNDQIFDMQRTQRNLERRVADAEAEADWAYNRTLNQ